MTLLLITSDTGETSEYQITSDSITIGRREDNDLCLPHLSVSGHHVRITREHGALIIEDLASTNGTLVNGTAVSHHVLTHLDEINLGLYDLLFKEVAEETRPISAEIATITPAAAPPDHIDPEIRIELEQDTRSIVSEIAALQVEGGPKSGDVFVLEKSVTTLGKRGDQAGAIARKDSGYYFVPLCLDAGNGNIKINGNGLTRKSEVKLTTGDNLELAGARVKFIYPFYQS